MTVQEISPRVRHQGDGATVEFPFAFRIYDAAQLQVIEVERSTGDEAVKILGLHYTVNVNPVDGDPGGSVIALVPPPATHDWLLLRRIPREQTDDYTLTGRAGLGTIEQRMDRLTLMVQDLAEEISRSFRVPRGDTPLDPLAFWGARANGFLRADANGRPAFVTDVLPGSIPVSGFGADFVATPTEVTARDLLSVPPRSRAILTEHSIEGGGDLTVNRTHRLVGDVAAPGPRRFYRTNDAGARLWDALDILDMPPGMVIDRAFSVIRTFLPTSAQIPGDDTVPQSGEGMQLLSVSLTPKTITNRVRIRFQAMAGLAGTQVISLACALFRGSNPNALHATMSTINFNWVGPLWLEFEDVPGVTTPQTYTIRVGITGTGGGAQCVINGNSVGRVLGGALGATLVAEEIVA